jgi:hypothetical protein
VQKQRGFARLSQFPRHLANLLILRADRLCKQGVAGSIPVTSTNFFFPFIGLAAFLHSCRGLFRSGGHTQGTRLLDISCF